MLWDFYSLGFCMSSKRLMASFSIPFSEQKSSPVGRLFSTSWNASNPWAQGSSFRRANALSSTRALTASQPPVGPPRSHQPSRLNQARRGTDRVPTISLTRATTTRIPACITCRTSPPEKKDPNHHLHLPLRSHRLPFRLRTNRRPCKRRYQPPKPKITWVGPGEFVFAKTEEDYVQSISNEAIMFSRLKRRIEPHNLCIIACH